MLWNHPAHDLAAVEEIGASSTVFYTAPVVGAPSVIERQIGKLRDRLHSAAIDVRRQVENAEMRRLLRILDDLRDRIKNPDGYRSQETDDAEDGYFCPTPRKGKIGGILGNRDEIAGEWRGAPLENAGFSETFDPDRQNR